VVVATATVMATAAVELPAKHLASQETANNGERTSIFSSLLALSLSLSFYRWWRRRWRRAVQVTGKAGTVSTRAGEGFFYWDGGNMVGDTGRSHPTLTPALFLSIRQPTPTGKVSRRGACFRRKLRRGRDRAAATRGCWAPE
jgi:hypothetical protein